VVSQVASFYSFRYKITTFKLQIITPQHPSIHPLIHRLNARRCPMFPHFLTRWVSRILGLANTCLKWANCVKNLHKLTWNISRYFLPMKYFKNYHYIWNISFEIFQWNITILDATTVFMTDYSDHDLVAYINCELSHLMILVIGPMVIWSNFNAVLCRTNVRRVTVTLAGPGMWNTYWF